MTSESSEEDDHEPLRDDVGNRLRHLRQCRQRALDAKMQSWRAEETEDCDSSAQPLPDVLRNFFFRGGRGHDN